MSRIRQKSAEEGADTLQNQLRSAERAAGAYLWLHCVHKTQARELTGTRSLFDTLWPHLIISRRRIMPAEFRAEYGLF